MRDRLIELLEKAAKEMDCPQMDEVADYLLSNGVIVPPCKVGTKIYFAGGDSGECLVGELMSFCLDAAHLWFNCKYNCGLNYWHPIEDFGKTVFLTKELAEKALAERSGK